MTSHKSGDDNPQAWQLGDTTLDFEIPPFDEDQPAEPPVVVRNAPAPGRRSLEDKAEPTPTFTRLVPTIAQLQETNETLRAVNIQLNAVNAEYRQKIVELSQGEQLSAIVESSGVAIIGHKLNGTIFSWNHGAEEIYGYTSREMIGSDSRLLYPPDSSERFEEVAMSIHCGESISQELRRRRRDGTIIDVLHTASPIYDHAGTLVGISTISRDITLRKLAEKKIQTAIRNRDQFLAMLSHELRNPLGAILNAAHLLDRAGLTDDRVVSASRIVRRQAEQMGLLLDDLLDVARVTQNKIVLRRQSCRLADVIAEAATVVTPLTASRLQQLDLCGLQLPAVVNGDPARLQQVVINLLKNASKYSPDGCTISVDLSTEKGQAVVRVRDTGAGIAPEMLDRMFDLFVQSQETLDRADGGLGVGLTLVRSIVELHGGTIEAASTGLGKGSQFTVRLPMVAAPVEKTLQRELPVTTKSPRHGLRIAIVEDNADSRSTLQSLLQLDGHEVRSAPDGIQGLELVSTWQPEVALIDIGLPGLDGFEVARRLRELASERPTRLVALTGYGLPSDRAKSLDAGFHSHLVKPLKLAELTALLAAIPGAGSVSG